MSKPRRDFFKDLLAIAAFQGFAASPASARTIAALFEQSTAQSLNPDFDAKAFAFWSNFLASDAEPILSAGPARGSGASTGAVNQAANQALGSSAASGATSQSGSQTQGGGAPPGDLNQSALQQLQSGASPGASMQIQSAFATRGSGGSADSGLRPVFLHYDADGFKNAAALDASKHIPEGDVTVSFNSSTIKICPEDQSALDSLQNAQVRLDVLQKNSILPVMEAMAYTVVAGMLSSEGQAGTASSSANPSSVQNVSINSNPAWQKMRNIILPGGEGRWALNLEAQKKDSPFFKLMQNVIRDNGRFAPVIGFPGVAMSALQSFNVLYGALHTESVPIIKSNPLRVFATQEAIQKTGAPGSVTGIMLKTGQYILMRANQAPALDDLNNLTVIQGRVVPQNTPRDTASLDAAAADTLKGVTYVSFDVQVSPTTLLNGGSQKKSS